MGLEIVKILLLGVPLVMLWGGLLTLLLSNDSEDRGVYTQEPLDIWTLPEVNAYRVFRYIFTLVSGFLLVVIFQVVQLIA
jgi:hypothetical protein